MAKLVILSGRHRGKKLSLPSKNKTLVVGRDEKCELRMASSDVSREHCKIRIEDGSIFVTDLGSSNGTQINDVSIKEETELKPGQFLAVGPMLMQLESKTKSNAPIPGDPVESDSFSNDNIASALAEDELDDSSTETTILKRSNIEGVRAASNIPVPPASKTQFQSIAEESADIIRRHLEWKANVAASEQG